MTSLASDALDDSYTAREAATILDLHYVSLIRQLNATPIKYPTAFKWKGQWRIPKTTIDGIIAQLQRDSSPTVSL